MRMSAAITIFLLLFFLFMSSTSLAQHKYNSHRLTESDKPFSPKLALQIDPPGEKIVIVDPNIHEWGAYDSNGELLHAGIATAGSDWCRDLHRRCHTKVGTFRVYSLGDRSCVSRKFPLGRGGAPMPYCMYFNGGQALHGSPSSHVVRGNISHGCVRLHVEDAKWLRFNFVEEGTEVIIKPY